MSQHERSQMLVRREAEDEDRDEAIHDPVDGRVNVEGFRRKREGKAKEGN